MNNNEKVVAFMFCESTTPANTKIIGDSNDCVKMNVDLQDTSEWNRNKRKYPMKTIKSGLMNERVRELIARKSWVGEAGHPIEPSVQRQCSILEKNISHRILSYSFAGPIVKGVVKTAPTERGRDMRNFILDSDAMESAYSLRAMGPMLQTAEGNIVQDPLTVITYDWVFYPSHRKAYQTDIITSIQESGNCLTESSVFELLQESAIDYIKHDSANFKLVSQFLDEECQNIVLSEDCRHIIIENKIDSVNNDKIAVTVEKFLSNEISSYFGKFR